MEEGQENAGDQMETKDSKMSPVATTVAVLVVAGILGLFAIWLSNRTQGESTNSTSIAQEQVIELPPQDIQVSDEDTTMNEAVTELLIEDTEEGTGAEAQAGDTISVHYTGTLLNGTKFDSSVDRGTPFTFELGAGDVIAGWDQGLVGMKVGGKRKLTIPADLAYGDVSPSPLIPAGSVLVFEVELLEIN